jgi:hypothetical protein
MQARKTQKKRLGACLAIEIYSSGAMTWFCVGICGLSKKTVGLVQHSASRGFVFHRQCLPDQFQPVYEFCIHFVAPHQPTWTWPRRE